MDDTSICCEAFFIIAVSDLDRAFEFYRRLFDAEREFLDRGLNFAALRTRVPGVDRVILWGVPPSLQFERSRIRGTRLTCRCDDLAHAHQLLSERGIAVGPIDSRLGVNFFVVTDPDGNEIGFFQFMAE
ncbi:MAG: VOC family protein [bacterium]|nr:VOC family protein [bacterium]